MLACQDGRLPLDDDRLQRGRHLLDDRLFRRQVLEDSLLETNNEYARSRLASYGLPEGWEELPEQQVQTGAVRYLDGVRQPGARETIWRGEVAWEETALLELGRAAFERWPAQPLPTVELALGDRDDPSLQRALGLWRSASGWVGGMVDVEYTAGVSTVAATCATCHARATTAGEVVHGPASDLQLDAAGGDAAGWSPGVLDVTADGVDDPVAIPDLRATGTQTRLHWSGNVRNGLLELTVRIETLLITNAGGTARPPREIAFALALYIQSLAQTAPPIDPPSGRDVDAGRELFLEQCAGCHSGSSGEGDWVSFEALSDPGTTSGSERSTGGYRVPSLHRVSERTRWTHGGFEPLADFFDATRLERFPIHPFGTDFEPDARRDLLQYLQTL